MPEVLIKINPDLQVRATVPFEVCGHCAALTGRMDLFIQNLISQGAYISSGAEAQVACTGVANKKKLNVRHINITIRQKSADEVVRGWATQDVHCGIKE